MDSDTLMRFIYLAVILMAVGGSVFVSIRRAPGRSAQSFVIWVLLFLGLAAAYGLWPDLRRALMPGAAQTTGQSVTYGAYEDGHFYVEALVNGVSVRFVIDTGASDIVLTREDAARAGVSADGLSFTGSAQTANGVVRTAPVRIKTFALGPWQDDDVRASVNDGEMGGSLLGMSYLSRFTLTLGEGSLELTRK